MFFCKIKKKGVVKPQCSGLKKIITKPQEFPEVLANIKTNKHKETGGGKERKREHKNFDEEPKLPMCEFNHVLSNFLCL